jgi:MFS transporter, DHA3 family, multidrug efflux protein
LINSLLHYKGMKIFLHLLVNSLFASVINFTVWFAITFFVYLETRSVFATAIISGIYLVLTAACGFWFGSLVDHHRKKNVMLLSSVVSLVIYTACFLVYVTVGREAFKDPGSATLWGFVTLLMVGVIAGNIRMIAMPTLVTRLIPEDRHDKANGLVGTTSGISFLVTSVISGVLVGLSGMFHVLILAIVVTDGAIVHLLTVRVPEKQIVHSADKPAKVDIKGTLKVISAIPGLFPLILFTTFNNFLGGVFMALMDAYGLSLVSVQVWGFLWGVLSTGFIIGGLVIAKIGLGKNPLRTMFLANALLWIISSIFTIQASIILLSVGMYIYMVLMPYIEAAEQTILQKVVPFERQGRVFGFAQSLEQTASPLTAFMIGPIAQFIAIPFMTTGAGVQLIGGWFGTGDARGIALVFTITGLIGLVATLGAMATKFYRQLSARYMHEGPNETVAARS